MITDISEKKTQDVFHKFNPVKSSLLLQLPRNYANFYTANSLEYVFNKYCMCEIKKKLLFLL